MLQESPRAARKGLSALTTAALGLLLRQGFHPPRGSVGEEEEEEEEERKMRTVARISRAMPGTGTGRFICITTFKPLNLCAEHHDYSYFTGEEIEAQGDR